MLETVLIDVQGVVPKVLATFGHVVIDRIGEDMHVLHK